MFSHQRAFSSFSVGDLERASAFYREVLGLAVTKSEMGLQVRLAGGGELFIYPKAGHVPASHTVLNFTVDDLEAAMQWLKQNGARFETYDGIDGVSTDANGVLSVEDMKIAWFRDPAGNVFSVIEESPKA